LNLLLDTHIALWAIAYDPRLPPAARRLIADAQNSVTVSVVSIWEIAIKYPLARIGHGEMPISGKEALGYFRDAGYTLLSVSPEHVVLVENLPLLHADPFDRLLVAQALGEPLRLITHDPRLAAYSDTVMVF
jgi:PIN domain nuclease of toxin-antitoxin system